MIRFIDHRASILYADSLFLELCISMLGKTLSHYSVSTLIGRRSTGEVYQARDKRLRRNLTIKVLPEELAKDADRLARFQRETKMLASLNQSNIASIYALEESNGTHVLVFWSGGR